MKKFNGILRKCKSISRLGRSSSYSSLRSKSTREEEEEEDELWVAGEEDSAAAAVVLVGKSRRRYTVNSKHLSHPLLRALIEQRPARYGDDEESVIMVKCEVVLFDHLLWMLENADLEKDIDDGISMEELAGLYIF